MPTFASSISLKHSIHERLKRRNEKCLVKKKLLFLSSRADESGWKTAGANRVEPLEELEDNPSELVRKLDYSLYFYAFHGATKRNGISLNSTMPRCSAVTKSRGLNSVFNEQNFARWRQWPEYRGSTTNRNFLTGFFELAEVSNTVEWNYHRPSRAAMSVPDGPPWCMGLAWKQRWFEARERRSPTKPVHSAPGSGVAITKRN